MQKTIEINSSLVNKEEYEIFKQTDGCIFCLPPDKKILIETKNFFITYDTSPILEGHVDIHTKQHIGCSAEIEKEHFVEYVQLKEWIGKILTDLYGGVSFYEHGRAGHCGIVVNGIECQHFHLHALPLKKDISEIISKEHDCIRIKSIDELNTLYETYSHYLLFENYKKEKYFYPIHNPIPSHYLRTVIANSIGMPERANWEKYDNLEAINSFKRKLSLIEA